MERAAGIYLDYAASTPLDARVLEAMTPYFLRDFANPSSGHRPGRAAARAIDDARATIAGLLNCQPQEIIFTSGGTESDNLALRGAAWRAKQLGLPARIITTPVEHSAVLQTAQQLCERMNFELTLLPVNRAGQVEADALEAASAGGAAIVSVIYANNELGSLNDLPTLAGIARERGILFHSDAVQAGGQLALDVQALGLDMLSLAAHKFYGPKGVGFLFARDGLELAPAQTGGGQEKGRRAGTVNTPLIVGMATALALAHQELPQRRAHLQTLREQLIEGVLRQVPGTELTGAREQRLPAHASFIVDGLDANRILMHLDMQGIAASSGSACSTGDPSPSAILLAAGYSREQALSSLRFSLGMHSSAVQVDRVVAVLAASVRKLRQLQALPA